MPCLVNAASVPALLGLGVGNVSISVAWSRLAARDKHVDSACSLWAALGPLRVDAARRLREAS